MITRSIQNLSLFLVDLAEERFTEDWIESIGRFGSELVIVTPGSFDELLDGRVTSPIIVRFKSECLCERAMFRR